MVMPWTMEDRMNTIDIIATFFGGLGFVGVVLLVIAALLWVVLPFAIFGIKRRLSRLIQVGVELHKTAKSIDASLNKGGNV